MALAILLTAGAMGGCMTEQSLQDSYQQPLIQPMSNILSSLKGQPSSLAFRRLNYPDDQKVIGDKKAYIWKTPANDCVIRLFVDSTEVVQNGDWRGSIIGCSTYIQRFDASH